MLACARRALVVLFAVVAAVAFTAPATSAITGSKLSLAPHHRTIHYNKPVRFSAQLRGALGPISNHDVTFWARSPHGSWHRIATARTNSHGWARLQRRLKHTTLWQARYGGDLLNNKSHSPITTIRVLPPPPRVRSIEFGRRVVREAARHHGAPYQYGAAGPYRFDCSGFTMYVLGRFHVWMPHNAAGQYDRTRHVSHAAKRLGDLIFFTGSGGIYHVGIYAGHGEMWAATHSGDVVRLESIYNAPYLVGRVR
jgi:peptidoglycan DL-endopeptidase CwlO